MAIESSLREAMVQHNKSLQPTAQLLRSRQAAELKHRGEFGHRFVMAVIFVEKAYLNAKYFVSYRGLFRSGESCMHHLVCMPTRCYEGDTHNTRASPVLRRQIFTGFFYGFDAHTRMPAREFFQAPAY